MQQLESMSNDDRNIIALFECLTYVAQSLANSFLPFAGIVYARCLNIIEQNIHGQQVAVCA